MALLELRITDLAVIDEATLQPGTALTALSGESGAGKSICIAALQLALGGRPETEMVRQGAEGARVAAVFDEVPDAVRSRLETLGIPDDDLLTLSRELPRRGRAMARINGALVSQAVLREIGDSLVEVTLQGAGHRLLQRARQREMVDAFGGAGLAVARSEMAQAFASWREAELALERAHDLCERSAGEVLAARGIIEELEPLQLHLGEDEELAGERERLRNAAAITVAAHSLRSALAGAEERSGAADLLCEAIEEARSVSSVAPELAALLDEAGALVDALRDLADGARRCEENIALDEGRLEIVEERLDLLARLKRRHGSIEAALRGLGAARQLVSASEGDPASLEVLRRRADECRAAAANAAQVLSAERAGAAAQLEATVSERLHLLGMAQARFRVVISRVADSDGVDLGRGEGAVACGPLGVDEVEFRLATARATMPLPLAEGPSGGELSRLALTLASVISEGDCATLVLDEVDTGISGEAAARVGEVLAAMGRTRQVLVITHRAEIAARADRHIVVKRADDDGKATSRVALVDGRERREEIARLMSGGVTPAALERADELLREAITAAA